MQIFRMDTFRPPHAHFLLHRPASENALNERMVITTPTAVGGTAYYYPYLRGYYCLIDFSNGHCAIVCNSVNLQTPSFTPNSTHQYSIDFYVYQGNPTTYSLKITDVNTTTLVVNSSGTDSTAGVQVAGLSLYAIGTNTTQASRIQTFTTGVAASFTTVPSSVVASSSTSVTVTGTNTAWTSGTTFSATNGTISGLSVNVGAQTATFTLLSTGAAGTPIVVSDSTDSATASIGVTAVVIPVTDSHLFCSPYNTNSNGTGAMGTGFTGNGTAWNVKAGSTSVTSDCSGWYGKTGFSGTSFALSGLSGGGRLGVNVDNAGFTNVTTTTGTSTLVSGLASGNHTIYWVVSAGSIAFSGISLDAGASLQTPSGAIAVQPNTLLFYSDSIGQGNLVGGSVNNGTNQIAELVWIVYFAAGMQCEVGRQNFSGQGYRTAGSSAFTFNAGWSSHQDSTSMLVGGLFSPAPTYILTNHGTNDASDGTIASDITTMISNLRTAAPSAKIFMAISFGQYIASTITAGVAAQTNANVKLLDPGAFASIGLTSGSTANGRSADGTHILAAWEPYAAAIMLQKAQSLLNTGVSIRPIKGGPVHK